MPMPPDLRRIAGSTQGECSVDDLKSKAYLIATEIRAQWGEGIEPDDKNLQETVRARVRKLFGHFANRPMRFAARLDCKETDDDGYPVESNVAARLAAPSVYEPLRALELREDLEEEDRALSAQF